MADQNFNRFPVDRQLFVRLFSKIKISEINFYRGVPCWEWQNNRNNKGYGMFCYKGIKRLAHTITYQLFIEIIPPGLECDHLCKNTGCVNPAHIEAVTHRENMLRSDSASGKNARKTHCPNGHAYLGNNLIIKRNGQRACRSCHNEKRLERYKKLLFDHPVKIKHREQCKEYMRRKRANKRNTQTVKL